MLPSEDEYSSVNFRFKLAQHYTDNGALPSVAFLVNGGVAAADGVLATVRLGWPIVIIKGSGGLADRIAQGKKDPSKCITDPMLTEIIQEGNLEFIELSEVDGGLCQQMIDRMFSSSTQDGTGHIDSDSDDEISTESGAPRLATFSDFGFGAEASRLARFSDFGFGAAEKGQASEEKSEKSVPAPLVNAYDGEPLDLLRQVPNLVTAWEKYTMYKDNAAQSKKTASALSMTLLLLGVLATALAALVEFTKKMVRLQWDGVDPVIANDSVDYMNWFLFTVPIIVSVIVAIENETRQELKAALLTSGAEVVLSHIYQYRTGVGDYSNQSRDSALQVGVGALRVISNLSRKSNENPAREVVILAVWLICF